MASSRRGGNHGNGSGSKHHSSSQHQHQHHQQQHANPTAPPALMTQSCANSNNTSAMASMANVMSLEEDPLAKYLDTTTTASKVEREQESATRFREWFAESCEFRRVKPSDYKKFVDNAASPRDQP
jgi:hypothetical protein